MNEEWNDKMPSWKSGSHIYPIDGAAHDVGADETPWAYRDARWSQVIIGVDPDPALAPALRDWTVGYWDAVHPYSAGGAYVNFMMDEGQDRVKATYGDNYDRLDAREVELRSRQRASRQPEHQARLIRTRRCGASLGAHHTCRSAVMPMLCEWDASPGCSLVVAIGAVLALAAGVVWWSGATFGTDTRRARARRGAATRRLACLGEGVRPGGARDPTRRQRGSPRSARAACAG